MNVPIVGNPVDDLSLRTAELERLQSETLRNEAEKGKFEAETHEVERRLTSRWSADEVKPLANPRTSKGS